MPASILFLYDYVDPPSYLMEREIRRWEQDEAAPVERIPFEARVPPTPMVDVRDKMWRRFWKGATDAAAAEGVALAQPHRVPWTRKAHELALHAREEGRFCEAHAALFDAFMLEGKDLGRVDVLLGVATGIGLDLTRTKAVLDVDRHADEVKAFRGRAERLGVLGVPTLLAGDRMLEGFRSGGEVRTFLEAFLAESGER